MKLCKKEASPVGLGTWKMGGGYWTPDYSNDGHYVSVIRHALGKGINVIDTAEMYGGGHAEELVGRAIKGLDREKIIVITKVWPSHLKFQDVIESARNSLRRLDSEYIDLYLIHWPNQEVKIEETMKAMEKLVEEGTVRCVGVSNFSVELMEEARKFHEIEANQVEYNLNHLDPEKDLMPYCERNGIKVIAYSPLGQGRSLSDERVKKLAQKYGRTPAQIVLNYIARRSIPIPKASSVEHVDEIASSLDFKLDDEDVKLLTRS
ncbi:aldo/keto reductase [Sulfuracidifex tepidarius]|uniref:NADP-dependent oxidoreductase domain-containing protein n=1 Tax=Sulfuracidifex tepidarius TaxID=1294262 RepID=A0A510DTR0_9CREN|nr:aldo/keto reductase [Sulfuracidifex tepidarius]BBG23616.1 hypothetical protein IC006_0904 [Sulfuracidifex tepidarius]BBG26364.1 hypothetical protein IC007_0872 [Sulfuracidifex tepidarius]